MVNPVNHDEESDSDLVGILTEKEKKYPDYQVFLTLDGGHSLKRFDGYKVITYEGSSVSQLLERLSNGGQTSAITIVCLFRCNKMSILDGKVYKPGEYYWLPCRTLRIGPYASQQRIQVALGALRANMNQGGGYGIEK